MNLDGTRFRVIAAAEQGIVSAETCLQLWQCGSRLLGRYAGGSIRRGYLVGAWSGPTLRFRYAQCEGTGHVHGGRSVCELEVLPSGRLRLHEHFAWETRSGSGTNTFDQIGPVSPNAT